MKIDFRFRLRPTPYSRFPCGRILPALVLSLLLPSLALASEGADLDNGEEINELCAGCHGEYGQGGGDGEYPRLAGQPASFTARQLHLFRDRRRPNMAMIEYVDERQMPDEDILDIAAYLEAIELPTRLPEIDPGEFDAFERLQAAKRVLNIPRAEGDIASGEKIYHRECASCHGREGGGRRARGVPMLAGQYTAYLWRQVAKYREGVRVHDPDDPSDRLLAEMADSDLRDIFAFLSVVDDR
jgi:cytochrome c553